MQKGVGGGVRDGAVQEDGEGFASAGGAGAWKAAANDLGPRMSYMYVLGVLLGDH